MESGKKDASDARARRLAREAETALSKLARLCFESLAGREAAPPESLTLNLRLELSPERDWKPTGPSGESGILSQTRALAAEAAARLDCFREGHAYCYKCDSAECEHGVPPRPGAVFKAYAPRGEPLWADLAQILLERSDPRVDRLFGERPDILAVVTLGRELKKDQLKLYGKSSRSYSILGQVSAGYFRSRVARDERFALTLQAVEFRGRGGKPDLALNIIGAGYEPEFEPEAVRRARGALGRLREELLNRGAPGDRSRVLGRIPGILRDLASRLERRERARKRRTEHASERQERDDRPVSQATRDTFSASNENILLDERRETLIVLGPRNRVHVFNYGGAHVTSLVLPKKSRERRVRLGRWQPADEKRRAELRRALLAQSDRDAKEIKTKP